MKAPNRAGTVTEDGYVYRMIGYVRKMDHVRIAERVLGRPLPVGATVHHVNGIKSDNRHENLVICQDESYHRLLHVRTRAYEAAGDANKRKCPYCKKYDDVLKMASASGGYVHRQCRANYHRHKRTAL